MSKNSDNIRSQLKAARQAVVELESRLGAAQLEEADKPFASGDYVTNGKTAFMVTKYDVVTIKKPGLDPEYVVYVFGFKFKKDATPFAREQKIGFAAALKPCAKPEPAPPVVKAPRRPGRPRLTMKKAA